MWNDWGDPFRLYPQLPFDILLPSDAKFVGKYGNQLATLKEHVSVSIHQLCVSITQ